MQLAKAILAKEQAVRLKREEELQLLAEGEAAMEAERKLKADKVGNHGASVLRAMVQ